MPARSELGSCSMIDVFDPYYLRPSAISAVKSRGLGSWKAGEPTADFADRADSSEPIALVFHFDGYRIFLGRDGPPGRPALVHYFLCLLRVFAAKILGRHPIHDGRKKAQKAQK